MIKSNKFGFLVSIALSVLITVPVFIKGVEFNALEIFLIPAGLYVGFVSVTKNITKDLINKRLFNTVIGLYSLLLSYILISLFYTYSDTEVYKEFFKWFEIFLAALCVFHYVSSKKQFSHAFWFLFFINLALVIKAVIFTDFSGVFVLPRIRIGFSTIFAIALLLPFAIKNKSKVLLYCLIIVLILSQARASWIGFVVIFALFVFQTIGKQVLSYRKVYFSILILTCCALLVPSIREIVHTRISNLGILGEDPAHSTYQRIYRLEACYYAFLDKPLLGIGAGNMLYHTEKMGKAEILIWLTNRHRDSITPHNIFAQYLAELGLIGFVIFISLLVYLYKVIIYVKSRKKSPEILGLYLYFFAFLVFITFGYIAGTDRIILGVYFGLILATLKPFTLYEYEFQK